MYTAEELGAPDRQADEVIRVYRPAEEVFSLDSLRSFANKTVTDDHPTEMVNAKNFKRLAVGFSAADVDRDGDFVVTTLHITDADAIKKIELGKSELSNGYTADIELIAGVDENGNEYDAVQTNIRGNHIAIVDRGRAGPECRVADSLTIKEDNTNMTSRVRINDVDFDVSAQAAQAVKALQTQLIDKDEKLDEMEEKLDEMKAQLEAMKKDQEEAKKTDDEDEEKLNDEDEDEEKKDEDKETKDSLRAKYDHAKSKVLSDKQLDERVEQRRQLVDRVLSLCPSIEWKGKKDKDLKRAVVMDLCPGIDKDQTDAYIDARFDILVESSGAQISLDRALGDTVKSNTDVVDTRSPYQIARAKRIEENRKAHLRGAK